MPIVIAFFAIGTNMGGLGILGGFVQMLDVRPDVHLVFRSVIAIRAFVHFLNATLELNMSLEHGFHFVVFQTFRTRIDSLVLLWEKITIEIRKRCSIDDTSLASSGWLTAVMKTWK